MAAEVGLVDLDGPLELLQLGLVIGGAALADAPVVTLCRIAMDARVLCDPGRRDAEPKQTRNLTAFLRRQLIATPPGTMLEHFP
jgi:hypothetical protein